MPKYSARPFTFALAGLALVASATGSNFSVSGPGGTIPDPGVTPGIWNFSYFGAPFLSSVTVANQVTTITTVKLIGLQHTGRGDLHIILRAPNSSCGAPGPRYNIVVRPGSTGGASPGDTGDYLSGDYTFVASGGGTVAQGATNISGGIYNQYFNTGSGMWTNGMANIALTSISGPVGSWELEIRDWGNVGAGGLTGWTLEGTDSGPSIISYCGTGDANVTQPCQGAAGASGNGCENSAITGGASLTAAGIPSCDTVVLTQTGELSNATSIFLQGTANMAAGTQFGDGVRCVGGNLKRLYQKNAVGGVVTAPEMGDPSIQTRSAALGDTITPGSIRYYQVYYRDPGSVSGLNFNVGNALQIQW
jgi:hypothetical protein